MPRDPQTSFSSSTVCRTGTPYGQSVSRMALLLAPLLLWSFPWAAKGAMKTSRPQWTPAYGRLEKTQAYNLSLGPSTHDLMVTVTSTRRASVVDIYDRGRTRVKHLTT